MSIDPYIKHEWWSFCVVLIVMCFKKKKFFVYSFDSDTLYCLWRRVLMKLYVVSKPTVSSVFCPSDVL